MQTLKEHHHHGGRTAYFSHASDSVKGDMKLGVFFPPQAEQGNPLPALIYLAGLTCTEETFLIKGGAQQFAAKHGIILVAPDTSPRGAGIAGEEDNWDFGTGAGFYINATNGDWANHYRMEDYIVHDLQGVMRNNLNVDMEKIGVFGHSMGGHGALTLGFKYPDIFKSISAFAPISAPTECPWGEKAFSGYIGDNREDWKRHDAAALMRTLDKKHHKPVLVDQGLNDEFLDVQLKPHLLEQAATDAAYPLTLHRHAGYDHSYYFISTFMEDHLAHHAGTLCSS